MNKYCFTLKKKFNKDKYNLLKKSQNRFLKNIKNSEKLRLKDLKYIKTLCNLQKNSSRKNKCKPLIKHYSNNGYYSKKNKLAIKKLKKLNLSFNKNKKIYQKTRKFVDKVCK